MRVGVVLGIVGFLLRSFSVAFLPPLALALYDGAASGGGWLAGATIRSAGAFLAGAAVTYLGGSLLARGFIRTPLLQRSEALGVVAGTWLLVGLAGGVPYVVLGLGPVDSFFESMSGFTTTGATILTDFSRFDRAFFLWRAMTQWFGGLGVIALFVVVLPRLGIAGRQIFFAEASTAPGEAVSPQVRDSARRLWILYVTLTLLEVGALVGCGMGLYEGVVHAFTTMSAGGFSPHPRSIEGYANPNAEWVFVLFMVLSGTSFTLLYRGLTRNPLAFVRDGEFLAYVGAMLVFTLVLAALLAGGVPTLDALRTGAFQVASLASSTGYASADFETWGDGLKTILILAMVVGGCAGSACGGAKVIRYVLTTRWLAREFTQVLHPRAVIPIRYRGLRVVDEVMRAVTTLVFLYVVGYALIGALVVVLEEDVDIVTGFTAALACLGNIGPAFGEAGPMGSYAGFSAGGKLILALAMWIGRLEIVTVLALLHPHVWRHLGWRGTPRGEALRADPGADA